MHLGGFPVFLASISLVFADVKFTSPLAGAQIPASKLAVTWQDSGIAPSISDLKFTSLTLYAGSNTALHPVFTFPPTAGFLLTTGALAAAVGTDLGGSTPNAYFLGLKSASSAGGFVTNYSDRFTLTGMLGVFPADVQAALATVAGTAGPPTLTEGGSPAAPGAAGDFGIPYNQQTGLTKYAPMQPLPPKSITAQNTAPLWPTSAVVIATTFLPIPSIQTTITQPGTYTFNSHPNTAAAQSQPTGDMEKFLNRWKD